MAAYQADGTVTPEVLAMMQEKSKPSAGYVEQLFRTRLSNMADLLTDTIDKYLTDPEWLAHTNNYYLDEQSQLRYIFNIRAELSDDQWPERIVTNYLVTYYTKLGWLAEYNEASTDLKLTVKIAPITELE